MGRIVRYTCLLSLMGSLLFSQSMINRLKVPVIMKGTMGFGYDNNYLRLSDKEIREDDVHVYGISKTLDSPIMKPTVKLIYSPVIVDDKTTNIITSISYSHFSQSVQKSYLITNLSMELKLRSYSWLKIGFRYLPKYYLQNYIDRDIEPGKWTEYDYGDSFVDATGISYYECTFFSQKYYGSFSFPVKYIRKTWLRIYTDFTKEYYNPHFTEFDLEKYMVQFDINHRTRRKNKMKLSIAHGVAQNISYGSNLPSTGFDRSYIFDKVRGETIFNIRKLKAIDDAGISVQLEQRYYDLLSEKYSIGNWKYYLDGRAKVWVDWDIIDDIGFKTYYQFRWRDASTQIYGDFEWVEDVKSYSKHEFWLEFSYKFITDILY